MKHTFTIFLLAVCSSSLHAQYRLMAPQPPTYGIVNQTGATLAQVMGTMYANANPADTGEGGEQDQIKQFGMLWQGRVAANDSSGQNMFMEYYSALRTAAAARIASPCTSGGEWQLVGPGSLPVQVSGYTNAIWADTGTDSNYILAGSIYAGLFKTMDGGGHWGNCTDGTPIAGGMMGVNNIAVNTQNINTIYLGTSGAAILESFDRGATWRQEFIQQGSSPSIADTTESTLMYITQDSARLYAICGNQLYTRTTSGGAWANITPPLPADTIYSWTNMAFVPGHPSHFFITGTYWNMYRGVGDTATHLVHQTTGIIWESKAGVWTDISARLVDYTMVALHGGGFDTEAVYHDTDMALFNISVPDTNNLYAISIPLFSNFFYPGGGLYKYNYNSRVWTNLNQGMYSPNGPRFEITVSPADSTVMYYGTLQPYFSNDGGNTFNPIGQYWGEPTHGDVRAMWLQHATSGDNGQLDRLYLATDGGCSLKPSGVDMVAGGANATVDISGTGLACGTYFSFATGEAGGLGMGGMMHDGIVSYEPEEGTPWKSLDVSDAWGCAVDKSKPVKAYGWLLSNQLVATDTGGGREMDTLVAFPQPNYTEDPGFSGVGKQTETDAHGNIYCVGSNFWRKRPSDTIFLDMYNPRYYSGQR